MSIDIGWFASGGEPWWAVEESTTLSDLESIVRERVDAQKWFTHRRGYADAFIMIGFAAPESPNDAGYDGYLGVEGGSIQWNAFVDDAHLLLPRSGVIELVTSRIVEALFEIGRRRKIGPPVRSDGTAWEPDDLHDDLIAAFSEVFPHPEPDEIGRRFGNSYSHCLPHPTNEVRLSRNTASRRFTRFFTTYRQSPFQDPLWDDLSPDFETAMREATEAVDTRVAEIISNGRHTHPVHVIARGRAAVPAIECARSNNNVASCFLLVTQGDLEESSTTRAASSAELSTPVTAICDGTAQLTEQAHEQLRRLGVHNLTVRTLDTSSDEATFLQLRTERALLQRRWRPRRS